MEDQEYRIEIKEWSDAPGHVGELVWVVGFTGNESNLLPVAHFFVTIGKAAGRVELSR
jgi:hypothetical protein